MIRASIYQAARVLAGWTLKDLAEKADLSHATLVSFEKNPADAGSRTHAKIERAFRKAGVALFPDGPRLVAHQTHTIEGDNWYPRFLEYVLDQLAELPANERIYKVFFADNSASLKRPDVLDMLRKMRDAGIAFQYIVEEGNKALIGKLEEYRYIPSSSFVNRPLILFGDAVGKIRGDQSGITILHDPESHPEYHRLFSHLWQNLEQPKESTANVRI